MNAAGISHLILNTCVDHECQSAVNRQRAPESPMRHIQPSGGRGQTAGDVVSVVQRSVSEVNGNGFI